MVSLAGTILDLQQSCSNEAHYSASVDDRASAGDVTSDANTAGSLLNSLADAIEAAVPDPEPGRKLARLLRPAGTFVPYGDVTNACAVRSFQAWTGSSKHAHACAWVPLAANSDSLRWIQSPSRCAQPIRQDLQADTEPRLRTAHDLAGAPRAIERQRCYI